MNKMIVLLGLFLMAYNAFAQSPRVETVLKEGWKFTHSDNTDYSKMEFDDAKWDNVSVPHDWAISGPFDNNNDKQTVVIEQNGETDATEHTGRTGSLPWVGTGWYRLHFKVDRNCERAILNFDGAMAEPVVYVNGKKAGEWKYGYNAFNVNITPYINTYGSDNVLAVRLQNLPESSRWYPGAGLFRPVTLIQTAKAAVDVWGIEINTLAIDKINKTAKVEIKSMLVGSDINDRVIFELCGREYSTQVKGGIATTVLSVENVEFWSPENPKLYDLKVTLTSGNGEQLDEVVKKVGIRTISITGEYGFRLNGVTRKFKGVCLHHDLGMIGTAINKAAIIRQIKLLKTMGCDAIRTAHNMPSQIQMDVCDSLGIMVMAESFDMWIYPKCKNGYCRYYKDWWERDLTNLVMANRLHPSIVIWSIGNEIPEQGDKQGTEMLKTMQNLIHQLDSTRICTTGMDRVDNAIWSGFADAIDVPGLNYRTQKYLMAHNKLHQGFILGSETASTVSSRGVYKFPVVRADDKAYSDGRCSSYDMEACWWSNIPEDDWVLQDDNDWVIGEFVWTGFDYLGEPTPYDDSVNARSSYFGIFDLAGLPKDRYWLYRSRWNKTAKTIHLLPHWTWPGREGEVTPVYCYTNYPSAELFVNGKSQGRITKKLNEKVKISGDRTVNETEPLIDRYRLRWNDVKYEPGEIRVVVYDYNGTRKGEVVQHTAGTPDHLEIALQTLDEYKGNQTMKTDGEDMAFFVVSVVDKDGNICPDADNRIKVNVKGAADFKGICNGDATSFEAFTNPTMKVFNGQLAIGVISNGSKGSIKVSVSAEGLQSSSAMIKAK